MYLTSSHDIHNPEQEVLWLPQNWEKSDASTNPYGVVYCHGNGDHAGSPQDIFTKSGQFKLVSTIVDAGFPVVVMDLGQDGVTPGGKNGWGNETCVDRVGEAFDYMTGVNVGAKAGKVFLVGISAGGVSTLNYAKANQSKVAGVINIIPVSDLDDIYQNNRLGLRAAVGVAHGVTYPEPLPEDANPLTSPGFLAAVDVYLSYSTADTVIIASTVVALAEAIGAEAVVHSTSLEHSEASILEVDFPRIIDWMLART